jgi:hypothetical protein
LLLSDGSLQPPLKEGNWGIPRCIAPHFQGASLIFFFFRWGGMRSIAPHPGCATRACGTVCERAVGRYAVRFASGGGQYSF